MGLRTPPSRSYDGSVPMSSTSQRGHSMARKNDDNFYRRQQDEANRLAATQCSGKIERRRKAGPWLPVEGVKP